MHEYLNTFYVIHHSPSYLPLNIPPFLCHTSSTVTFTYFRNDFSLVMSVVYQLKKIYRLKRPGHRFSITVPLLTLRQQWACTKSSTNTLLASIEPPFYHTLLGHQIKYKHNAGPLSNLYSITHCRAIKGARVNTLGTRVRVTKLISSTPSALLTFHSCDVTLSQGAAEVIG